MVDANMRWTADQAIRASRALAEHDVFWLEEPTTPDDLPGHVRIVREGALPVAAGENLRTLSEFERLIDAGGVSFPEPDVSNCGGISVWLRVAHVAEARHLPVTSHGVHDLHVHLLAAVPNASYLEVHGFGLERFIAHPLELVDGEAVAPERPGHGVEFDWKALETLPAPA
jgi:L-alanine-DL-glutamate epimerase-like enolase superfamily enzyme